MNRILLSMLVLAMTLAALSFAQQDIVATVIAVNGQLQFREKADSAWKPAKKLDSLSEGCQIRTGTGSRAILVCNFTGTRVLMNENTHIEVHSLINTSHRGQSIGRTKLLSGEVHVKGRGGRYELDTPAASVKASGDPAEYGTVFQAGYDTKTGAASFLVFQNAITIANAHGSVLLEKYQAVEVKAGRKPGTPRSISEEQALLSLHWLKNF
ncbi:MAG: FecR family protein [Candidatus Latescibacterota bacterium]